MGPNKAKALSAVSQAKSEAVETNLKNNTQEIDDDFYIDDNDSNENETDELWGTFDAKIAKASDKLKEKSTNHIKETIDLEMKQYLESPNLDRKSCPIKWWATIGRNQYPYLFNVAKKFLCMNATSVPSERVFSKAGTIINNKRAALGKITANMLITLNINL